MTPTALFQAIRALAEQFTVEVRLSAARVDECYRLRRIAHDVDWPFAAGQDGAGDDEFDQHAQHVALVSRRSGAVAATARLVLPLADRPEHSFPMQRLCTVALPADMPIQTTADVSCFALSRQRRLDTAALIRLGLFQGLVRLSGEIGITHWCAIMEPTLLRLLRMTGIPFTPIGPLLVHNSPGQPCYNSISVLLSRVYQERPQVWEYLTDGGLLCFEALSGVANAAPDSELRGVRH
jgi:N-acyl-L-homoserine lactone synthetase